jgi:prevent-host-death family protein
MTATNDSLRPPTKLARISELSTFTTTELKNHIGTLLERADSEAIAVTRHKRPKYVVLPAAVYETIVETMDVSLVGLNAEFDEMVARMNTPQAAKAFDALFEATSDELGASAANTSKANG